MYVHNSMLAVKAHVPFHICVKGVLYRALKSFCDKVGVKTFAAPSSARLFELDILVLRKHF